MNIGTDTNKKPRFLYNKGNYSAMREELAQVGWKENFAKCTAVQEKWNVFADKMREVTEKHIPKSSVNKMNTKVKPKSQLDKKALAKVKKKYKLWKRYLNTRNGEIYQEYCRVRNQVRRITRRSLHNKERDIAKEAKSNPKKFWKYVQEKLTVKNGIPDLNIPGTETQEDGPQQTKSDKQKAEVLNNFFASVFTEEGDMNVEMDDKMVNHTLKKLEITQSMVINKLKELKTCKSPGPDYIHPRILKETHLEIAEPICDIFNDTLKYGHIPKEWKKSNITAIFKKGNKAEPGNYRPVSLTCILCKILESIIRDHLMEYMYSNEFFSTQQYGFPPGRSTVLQLLRVLDDWTNALDDEDCIDVIYCDFQKAFDTVPHKRLLYKLKKYGVTGPIHEWIQTFLTRRKQRVVINGIPSDEADVKSGIPKAVY